MYHCALYCGTYLGDKTQSNNYIEWLKKDEETPYIYMLKELHRMETILLFVCWIIHTGEIPFASYMLKDSHRREMIY